MPTIAQIRAARALLDWSQSDLAEYAGLSQTGIARIENGTNKPNSRTLEKINSAFDRANIEFIGDTGVKKKTDHIRVLRGQNGFVEFLQDVYATAKNSTQAICVSNVNERDFDQWFGEFREEYLSGMTSLNESGLLDFKILVQEGDEHHIASYAKYRAISKEQFGTSPFYVYGNKLAILLFSEDDVSIFVIENKEIADAQRKQFNISWNAAN